MSNDGIAPPAMPPAREGQRPRPAKGPNTCLIAGAIGCLVVIALIVIAGVGGYFAVKGVITGLVDEYTDTEPAELPVVEVSDEELEALQARVAAFKAAVEGEEAPVPEDGTDVTAEVTAEAMAPGEALVLSERDINALIQNDPEWQQMKGKIYVSIEDDLVKGEVSFPLDELEFEMVKGRYFNGSATFNVHLRNGALFVTMDSATLRGTPVPDEFMAGLRAENLAKNYQQDPEFRKFLDKLDSIEVEDGTISITPAGP
jgi:hypothetical protein